MISTDNIDTLGTLRNAYVASRGDEDGELTDKTNENGPGIVASLTSLGGVGLGGGEVAAFGIRDRTTIEPSHRNGIADLQSTGHSQQTEGETAITSSHDNPLAREAPIDLDLAPLIDAWPTLPKALRAGILAMIEAARNSD